VGGEFLHFWDKFYLKILEIPYTVNSKKIAEILTKNHNCRMLMETV